MREEVEWERGSCEGVVVVGDKIKKERRGGGTWLLSVTRSRGEERRGGGDERR